jgi:hypothetical protein
MKLKNVSSGHIIQAPTGFSFTTLFFGFCVPLLRGDYLGAIIMMLVLAITGGISILIFPFFYNDMYIKSLFKMGYVEVV